MPVDTVNEIVPQLIRRGYVTKADLGVKYAEDAIARRCGINSGVLIAEVTPNSPAHKAGLRTARVDRRYVWRLVQYDIIQAVDGEPVPNNDALYRILEDKKVGDKVKLKLVRNGEEKPEDVVVTLSEVRG